MSDRGSTEQQQFSSLDIAATQGQDQAVTEESRRAILHRGDILNS